MAKLLFGNCICSSSFLFSTKTMKTLMGEVMFSNRFCKEKKHISIRKQWNVRERCCAVELSVGFHHHSFLPVDQVKHLVKREVVTFAEICYIVMALVGFFSGTLTWKVLTLVTRQCPIFVL